APCAGTPRTGARDGSVGHTMAIARAPHSVLVSRLSDGPFQRERRGNGTPRRRWAAAEELETLGAIALRAAVGHGSRGLLGERSGLGVLPPRPRALARLPLGRGRAFGPDGPRVSTL